jgi:hypothetical protein
VWVWPQALASPAVSPSASPDGAATPASASAKEITEAVESSRQMKLRLQKEAIMEEKVRAKRKNAAFKKVSPGRPPTLRGMDPCVLR